MSGNDPNAEGGNDAKPKGKDPASVDRLERIENGVGTILDTLQKGKGNKPADEPPVTPPAPPVPSGADGEGEDDEVSEADQLIFGSKKK